MKLNDKRRRYDLYLTADADARLIEHLEKFTAARRTNEELRRMLYLALDGVPGPARPPVIIERPQPTGAPASSDIPKIERQDDPPAEGKGAKLKKLFGMPG